VTRVVTPCCHRAVIGPKRGDWLDEAVCKFSLIQENEQNYICRITSPRMKVFC
jgi:hypothetical protein